MRKTILAVLAAALLASLPCFAAEPSPVAGSAPPVPALATAPAAGCGQAATGIQALHLQSRSPGVSELAGPACSLAVASGVELGSKPFHGFCKCSCSFIPDCNSSADCGGAACIHAITCC